MDKPKTVPSKSTFSAFVILALSVLACRPVMTVGFTEIFILIALITFLFGPILYRIFTWYQKYKADQREKEDRRK